MADGELTLKLDEETTRRLKEAANAAGVAVEAFAADAVTYVLALDSDVAEDLRIIDEYDRTGVSHSVEEVLGAFDAAVTRRLDPET
jgi:predicted transcriptional regulator